MAGLDLAIHATSVRFANGLKFRKNYQLLDRQLSVLVDGRIKPGHDEKPPKVDDAATSNS